FSSRAQSWYHREAKGDTTQWTLSHDFPDRRQPAITYSGKLVLYNRFVGVIAVTIELKRISQYLAGLHIGNTGTVVVLDSKAGIVASPDPDEQKAEDRGNMRNLSAITMTESPLLVVARDAIAYNHVKLDQVNMARPLAPFR